MSNDAHYTAQLAEEVAVAIASAIASNSEVFATLVAHEDTLLTVEDLMVRLKVKKRETVLNMIKRGQLPGAFKLGRDWRISRKEYRKALARHFKPHRKNR